MLLNFYDKNLFLFNFFKVSIVFYRREELGDVVWVVIFSKVRWSDLGWFRLVGGIVYCVVKRWVRGNFFFLKYKLRVIYFCVFCKY